MGSICRCYFSFFFLCWKHKFHGTLDHQYNLLNIQTRKAMYISRKHEHKWMYRYIYALIRQADSLQNILLMDNINIQVINFFWISEIRNIRKCKFQALQSCFNNMLTVWNSERSFISPCIYWGTLFLTNGIVHSYLDESISS